MPSLSRRPTSISWWRPWSSTKALGLHLWFSQPRSRLFALSSGFWGTKVGEHETCKASTSAQNHCNALDKFSIRLASCRYYLTGFFGFHGSLNTSTAKCAVTNLKFLKVGQLCSP